MRRVFLLCLLTALASPAWAQQPAAARAPGQAWLGVSYDVRWAEAGGRCETRMVVEGVAPGSPAARAGLQAGDIVVALDGQADPARRLPALAARLSPGDSVRLEVERDGTRRRLVAIAAARPSGSAAAQTRPPASLSSATPVQPGPVVEVRGDTIMARNLPMGSRLGGFWLVTRDGQSVFRPLTAQPTDPLDRRVADLLACAGTGVMVAQAFRADPESILVRAESLRVAAARRVVERPAGEGRIVIFRDGPPVAGTTVRPAGVVTIQPEEALASALRGVAGAELVAMEPELAAYFRGTDTGLLVVRVSGGSAAERAGLRPGDVIAAAAGRSVTTVSELRAVIAGPGTGGGVELSVVRQGQARTVSLPRP
jgi:membrane-associated protease RseP (regulator of RpoE activity)